MYIRRCGHYNGPLWAHFITLAVCLGLCILEPTKTKKKGKKGGGGGGGRGKGRERGRRRFITTL